MGEGELCDMTRISFPVSHSYPTNKITITIWKECCCSLIFKFKN